MHTRLAVGLLAVRGACLLLPGCTFGIWRVHCRKCGTGEERDVGGGGRWRGRVVVCVCVCVCVLGARC